MSYSSNRTNIESLFFTEFAIAEPGIDISVENDNYKPSNDAWVRLSIQHATTEFITLGNVKERFRGFVQVQIFTRLTEGASVDDRISDSIADIFRGRKENGVSYLNTVKVPAVIEDGWLHSQVVTEFWADESY